MSDWIEYGKSWKDFADDQLNNSGTVIECDDGATLLIGNINELSGVCDCCAEFTHGNTIIVRYKVVYTK